MPEVSRETQASHTRMLSPQAFDLRPRPVTTPVIDDDDLEVALRDGGDDLGNDARERLFFVVRRHHDGDEISHGST